MKVAYWPGCVSRGFTPELHGSMAQVAPLLDIELVALDRASLLRRGRDRRAQPGARRHAQRAHVRARAEGDGRRRRADDEHLLDLPGRADRVPGAARRQLRVPRAHQRDARARGPDLRARHLEQELPLADGRGDRPRRDQGEGQAPADRPARRPVLRLLHRPPDRAPRDRRRAPARPLPADADRGARRHRRRLRRPVQVLRLPDHHHEPRGLAEAGRPPPRRRDRRRRRLPGHAVPALPPQPRPPAARRREGRRARRSACRCCTSRSSSASRSGSSPRSSAWQARGQADVGDRLVDLRGRRRRRRLAAAGSAGDFNGGIEASSAGARCRRSRSVRGVDRRCAHTTCVDDCSASQSTLAPAQPDLPSSAVEVQAAARVPTSPRACSSSASCTALVAAPLRRLSRDDPQVAGRARATGRGGCGRRSTSSRPAASSAIG